MKLSQTLKKVSSTHRVLSIVILICAVILSYTFIIQPWAFRPSTPTLQLGDVATQDLRAPKKIEFVSEIRTEEARQAAERAVEPVYAPPDPEVALAQIDLLRSQLNEISRIRMIDSATYEEKLGQIQAMEGFILKPGSINNLLTLTDESWLRVSQESLRVLEQVMRNTIRSDNLDATQMNIASLVNLTLNNTEVSLVVDLVTPLVIANSFYSPELTDAARVLARNKVEPVMVSYRQGEMIVSSGQVITPVIYEALKVQGLIIPMNHNLDYLGGGALVLLCLAVAVLYLRRTRPAYLFDLRSLLLISILFLVFLEAGRLSLPNRTIVPYLFPLPAFGLLISALYDLKSAVVFSLLLSLLTAYGLPNAFDLTLYYFLCSVAGVLALGSARRIGHFLWAAAIMAGVGAAIIVAYRYPFFEIDLVGLTTLSGAAIFNSIASTSLALLMQFLLAQFLGSTTTLQLLEISRPDYPLMKYFLRQAPGTYQHSLLVMNLAEQAAEMIGADALLTRVGALYHDVGKSENASFFIENQRPGNVDAHNGMAAEESAATIIAHVTDGLMLARKYRLPNRLMDFIREHHGTLITRYQYNHAIELAGGDRSAVDIEKFRYPGPAPRSRETALVMIADGAEAIVRAQQPNTDEERKAIVKKVVENVQKEGQLDDTPLTQRDLVMIIESIGTTMQGASHPRLVYPEEETARATPATMVSEPATKPRSPRSKGK